MSVALSMWLDSYKDAMAAMSLISYSSMLQVYREWKTLGQKCVCTRFEKTERGVWMYVLLILTCSCVFPLVIQQPLVWLFPPQHPPSWNKTRQILNKRSCKWKALNYINNIINVFIKCSMLFSRNHFLKSMNQSNNRFITCNFYSVH